MDAQQEKDEKKIIKISVRNLVEFILREGDIDNRHGRTASPEAMWEGSRIHKRIQKSKGANYHAEVPLKIELSEGDYTLAIEGRADGIEITCDGERQLDFSDNFNHLTVEEDMHVTIDEIKGIYMNLDALDEPVGVHRAQAMCYAYIYALQHDLAEISVQLTYCNLDTIELTKTAFLGNLKYFRETFSFAELAEWFTRLTDEYKKWADFQFAWQNLRQASIKKLEFPYAYRKGQKELASDVYRTIARRKNLFIQAPTGVGKTISTVFPAVKAVGEGLGDKIFYLTAKTITGTVAKEAFELLRTRGYQAKIIQLTAKEKLCLCEEMDCNPVHCPYAKGHYDRVNDAVYNLLQKEDVFTREVILEQAREYRVCPFEMSLDTATWADDIIGDYNYVFDPNVYLKRFFAEGTRGDYIFLVDEAHNLVERGREMYSARLVKEDFLAVKKIVKAMERHEKRPEVHYILRKFEKSLEAANRVLLAWKKECDEFEVISDAGMLEFALLRVAGDYELVAKEYPVLPERDTILSLYFDVRRFLAVLEKFDESDRIYLDYDEERKFRIKIQCMDPSGCLKEVMERVQSTIFFSATLLPIRYYKEQLGGEKEDAAVYAKSVFLPEQRKVMIARDVTTKYTRRGATEYEKIAAYIDSFISAKEGNYLLFFPSYRFMDEIVTRLPNRENQKILVQMPEMREREREEFLEAFSEETDKSVIGCCVMGGIFSEGIDLKEECLIGAVVVGTGIPMVCHERELFKDYYEEKKGDGFSYAYLYPAVNKVFQAGGRVIRTINDKGAILLLDERFMQKQYQDLFPREWYPFDVVNCEKMKELLAEFWQE